METLRDWFNGVPTELISSAISGLLVVLATFLRDTKIMQRQMKLWQLIVTVLVIFGLGIVGVAFLWPDEKTEIVDYPDVSLLSARFFSDNFNPRLIDFRTAEIDGVPIVKGLSLKLEDLWVWASESSSEYSVNAEVYAYPGGKYIGGSGQHLPLQKGAFELGDIKPQNYVHGEIKNAWMVQDDWTSLAVSLVLYRDREAVKTTHTIIKINPDGKAWLWDTPNAHLISVTYSINNGPDVVLNLLSATTEGINVQKGDTITLREVWYKSDSAGGNQLIHVGGYLTSNGYDPESETYSPYKPIESGVKRLDGVESVTWQVRPDDRWWVLWLTRDDRTALGGYEIPLNIEDSGD